ncbi:MAG: hypothetical protein H0V72_01905 [Bradyrhizobium sp.]|nr:hypothetical protein [Bradyrhizobium sp.]
MASNARIFFAGAGTTFVILGAGFGGGLFMANSALREPVGSHARVSSSEPPGPVRVILPTSAEAAQAPQLPQKSPQQVEAVAEPVRVVEPEKRVEKIDTKKAEAEVRERRKRYAERKSKREAARARQQLRPREQEEAPVMAFGGNDIGRPMLFGN